MLVLLYLQGCKCNGSCAQELSSPAQGDAPIQSPVPDFLKPLVPAQVCLYSGLPITRLIVAAAPGQLQGCFRAL